MELLGVSDVGATEYGVGEDGCTKGVCELFGAKNRLEIL